ncbi:cobalamin-binding protein [Thioalkalivibrio sp.]|uniref:cobalamin-binding protein n=1 Tax=Thioalkalivibrio sp. TaxID=2093813 RepID=UPI0039762ECB
MTGGAGGSGWGPVPADARARRRCVAGPALALWLCLPFAPAGASAQDIVAIDDRDRSVQLAKPAQRIVSLAPHLTELLFAVGAGDRIVATVAHADFPAAAREIPRIGTATQLDLERLLAARPDLVIAWDSGNPRSPLERLERLGLTVYYSEPSDFAGIADDLRRLGRLTGSDDLAERTAQDFEDAINALRVRYSERPPVTLFYQVWDRPLMTVNDTHLIGEAIRLCGGRNIFGDLEALVPRPGKETVLASDPEAIVSGGPGEDRQDWLEPWAKWTSLTAVRRDNLFFIPPSLIQRHTPRIARGTRMLCEALETARSRRGPEAPP